MRSNCNNEEKNLLFIKLGGSLITKKDTPFTINYGEIKRIVKGIKEAIESAPKMKLLIGHGGGSFPHPIADLFNTSRGFVEDNSKRGFALCQNAASLLNRIFVVIMTDYGLNAVSIQPSACCIAKDGEIADFFIKPIETSINKGIIPVVFGDCVFDSVKGCTIISTEQILAYLSKYIRPKPSRVLIFTSVGGVYTSDPQKDKKASLIPEIRVEDYSNVEAYLEGSREIDVTGGMRTKVIELIKIAKIGIECGILSVKTGHIKEALTGGEVSGTVIRGK